MPLLNDNELERSSVIANCCMNRERSLTGSNGYSKDLGFNPLDFMQAQAAKQGRSGWLDLCCGSGKALVEAAEGTQELGLSDRICIVGVDLINTWPPNTLSLSNLQLVEASLSTWQPGRQFDLITCVHGLHYIGDKLGLVARVVSCLTDHGRFIANLDLSNVQVQNCSESTRIVGKELKRNGFVYNSRKKLISCDGRREIRLPFCYLGADDRAGPNYTGQPAVNSHYEWMDDA